MAFAARGGRLPLVLTAAILSAGYGTRLRPLTEALPKPLVWIGDRPLLRHIVERLKDGGVRRCLVNLHHLSEVFSRELARWPSPPETIFEPEILGTAGSIALMGRLAGGSLLVHNGDILADVNYSALAERAQENCCLAVAPRHPVGEGALGLDSAGNVVRLRDELFGEEARGADYVGIAAFGWRSVQAMPERGCWIGDFALPRLRAGGRLATLAFEGSWCDVGDVRAYLEANLAWLKARGEAVFAGPGAVLDDVAVDHCVIGAGAKIAPGSRLSRCVVWPGAKVGGNLRDSVIMSEGRIVAVE